MMTDEAKRATMVLSLVVVLEFIPIPTLPPRKRDEQREAAHCISAIVVVASFFRGTDLKKSFQNKIIKRPRDNNKQITPLLLKIIVIRKGCVSF